MRSFFLLLLLLLLAGTLPACSETVLQTDFGRATQPVHVLDGAKQISGMLPDGWQDGSAWNSAITLQYLAMTEHGTPFLRVQKTRGGQCQLVHNLPDGNAEGYYRLTFTARSRTGSVIETGIRMVGSPYSFIWSASPLLDARWQTYHYNFHLDKPAQPVGVWINLSDDGAYDVRDFSLARIDRAALIAERHAAYPQAPRGNLVRNSRFPLGLQSGWTLGGDLSDGDDLTVASDSTVIGPSGVPALRIAGKPAFRLYTAPFAIPWWEQPHTLSLSLRGQASGQLVVVADGQELATQPYTVSGDGWTRCTLTFTPRACAATHGLRIEGTGTLWIDALQVEMGREAHPYAAAMPMEVALACAGSASVARTQFADEPATIDYCVTGAAPRAILKAQVVNVYGQAVALPPVKLASGFRQDGHLRYNVFPSAPYGAFRVEAWVESPNGTRLSLPNELVVNRLHRPRHWGEDAPDSFFGVHMYPTNRHLIMAKALGFNWVRLHDAGIPYIGWAFLEPKQGQWHFSDAAIQRYRDHHIKVLGLLSTAPGWATAFGKPTVDYFDPYMEPKNLDDFANYVKTVVTRYQGQISDYEIWNEPWGFNYWTNGYDATAVDKEYRKRFTRSATAGADFARLQETAYRTAKAADPHINIIGFNTYGNDAGKQWTRDLLTAGALASCDALSYHHYTHALDGVPQDDVSAAHQTAFQPILAQSPTFHTPIWMTEGNAQFSRYDTGMYRVTLPDADSAASPAEIADIANRLCRFVISHRAQGEAHLFIYSMHCEDYFDPNNWEWRAIVTADGYAHPATTAFSAMAWLLEDTHYVKTLTPAPGVTAYLFTGSRRSVAVLAGAPQHADYTVQPHAGIAVTDLFGNPISKATALGMNLVYLTSGEQAVLEHVLQPTARGAK
jgi:hypothetical protein